MNTQSNLEAVGVASMPIGELLAHHAARDPKQPAVTFDGVTIDRAELDARSNRKARQLAARGVTQGDVVTLALPNSLEFYETTFAIWKLGASPSSVSAKLPDAELRAIRPKLVVCLGATAAQAMLDRPVRIQAERGTFQESPGGMPVFVTIHPSAILRFPDPGQQEEEYAQLVKELALVRDRLKQVPRKAPAG